MFFLYGLVSWQSADPGIETYAVYWGGGGRRQEGQTVGNRQEITATGGRADSRLLE